MSGRRGLENGRCRVLYIHVCMYLHAFMSCTVFPHINCAKYVQYLMYMYIQYIHNHPQLYSDLRSSIADRFFC